MALCLNRNKKGKTYLTQIRLNFSLLKKKKKSKTATQSLSVYLDILSFITYIIVCDQPLLGRNYLSV